MSIKEIDPITLKQWMTEGIAILVDIRETTERAVKKFSSTHHIPLSTFNPADLPVQEGNIVVYHCVAGKRTAMADSQLTSASPGACDVYHLSGGMMAWKNARNGVS
jgi:rhodanese-related sulfurtransferase